MSSRGFGEQLAGKLVEIFVDFLQSVNFIFKFGNSHFSVFTVTKYRLKVEETHGSEEAVVAGGRGQAHLVCDSVHQGVEPIGLAQVRLLLLLLLLQEDSC